MKVGVVTASISRLAGGLFWSVRCLANSVQQAGCDVHIFSTNDEYSSEDISSWKGLNVTIMDRVGPLSIGYAPGMGKVLNMNMPDIIHSHGIWMFPSLVTYIWSKKCGRPVVISPRGMLDAWALKNSAWKKKLAGFLFENRNLRNAACLHALCESEYRAIREYGLSNPVAVIPNGVDLPKLDQVRKRPDWANNVPEGSKVLFFLSRIHPKKGLVNLLRSWSQAKKRNLNRDKPWILVIGGWDQGGHQEELELLVEDLKLKGSVLFVGPLFGKQKADSLLFVDGFILPSFSEGLPMAVLEAWSYRLPVLMTPQCNLPIGFKTGAALEIEPREGNISQVLKLFFTMSTDERREMGYKGRLLVEEQFTWPTIAIHMNKVYSWLINDGSIPECVIFD